jgi:hypothetical protein
VLGENWDSVSRLKNQWSAVVQVADNWDSNLRTRSCPYYLNIESYLESLWFELGCTAKMKLVKAEKAAGSRLL